MAEFHVRWPMVLSATLWLRNVWTVALLAIGILWAASSASYAQDRGSEKYARLFKHEDPLCVSVEGFLNERLAGKADPARYELKLVPWQKIQGIDYLSVRPDWAQPAIMEADINNDGTSEIVVRRTGVRGVHEEAEQGLLIFAKESFPLDKQAELGRQEPRPSWANWNIYLNLKTVSHSALYLFWELPGARHGERLPAIYGTGLFELIQSKGRAYWLVSENRGVSEPRDPDVYLLAEQSGPDRLNDKCYFVRSSPRNPSLAEWIRKYAVQ